MDQLVIRVCIGRSIGRGLKDTLIYLNNNGFLLIPLNYFLLSFISTHLILTLRLHYSIENIFLVYHLYLVLIETHYTMFSYRTLVFLVSFVLLVFLKNNYHFISSCKKIISDIGKWQ